MRSIPATVATLALAMLLPGAAPALAETRTAQYGAIFCERLDQLNRLIEALRHGERDAAGRLDGCANFRAGLPVDVLRVVDARAVGPGAIEVRVHEAMGPVQGFTLDVDVEDPTPTGP